MKKLLTIIFTFLTIVSFSQAVVVRTSGSTTPEDMNLFTGRSFRVPVFADTTAANAASPQLDSAGKLIYTYDIDGLWYRKNNPRRWELVGTGSGGGNDTAYVAVALTADSSGFILYHSNRNIAPDTVDFVGGGGGGGIDSTALSDTLNNYASYGALTMPNVLYSTPIALSVSNHFLSGTFTGTNISQYQILGRKASGSGAYSFLTADSTLIPDLHSENYYNTKYGSGGGVTGVDSTNNAISAGQTVFSFPYTLSDYTITSQVIRNGVVINPIDYSISGGDVTFTAFTCDSGDKIRFIGIK